MSFFYVFGRKVFEIKKKENCTKEELIFHVKVSMEEQTKEVNNKNELVLGKFQCDVSLLVYNFSGGRGLYMLWDSKVISRKLMILYEEEFKQVTFHDF